MEIRTITTTTTTTMVTMMSIAGNDDSTVRTVVSTATTATRILCELYASTRHTSAHPYLATIPGSGARDGKRLIIIVKRHGFRLSPTSCRPDRIRGLCDQSCRRCSKSCRRPRCSCEQCGPSCCSCNSFASRNDRNHCHLPGSCAPCDQSCCNCNNSTPVPGRK